ncbi:MAG: isoprenyl transferase [Lentisphaerae bacterium]|nr:isoprenyl transferase [Lentisphaerota bacterium]MCP4100420.1 isoprenyl transferase [Lentisphaerota bacterium]
MGNKEKKLRHVAIIMDGNGRWAKKRGLSHLEGHRKGAEAVQTAIETAKELGLEYLTLYAFSTENWSRPQEEVDGLMSLLEEFVEAKVEVLQKNNVRLKTVGRTNDLPESTRKKLLECIEKTAGNNSGTLVLAINYGGRAEIVDAAKKIARDAVDKKLDPDTIDENVFIQYMYDPSIPDPDMMIRTSGELRLSNFLVWELSYAEFYVTDILWPDFGREEFLKAADAFYGRERRYGGRPGSESQD